MILTQFSLVFLAFLTYVYSADEADLYIRQISEEDIAEQGAVLLQRFIVERFQRDGIENAPTLADIRGTDQESEHDRVWVEVGSLIREIGDALDRDQELQRFVSNQFMVKSCLHSGTVVSPSVEYNCTICR